MKRKNRRSFTRIEYETRSDDRGRCRFVLFWKAAGRERGQVFLADPRDYGFARPEEQTEGR